MLRNRQVVTIMQAETRKGKWRPSDWQPYLPDYDTYRPTYGKKKANRHGVRETGAPLFPLVACVVLVLVLLLLPLPPSFLSSLSTT